MQKSDLYELLNRLNMVQSELNGIKDCLNEVFTKEEQSILMYEASIGRNNTALNQMNPDEMKSYAIACQEYLRFGREVDACLWGALEQVTAIRLGRIPTILEKVGCSQKDMYITQKHLRSIVHESDPVTPHYHDIDIRQFKQIPELMEHPLAIISDKQKSKALVLILDAQDKSNDQLIVPVLKDGYAIYQGKRVDANFILSAYGKRNIEQYLIRSIDDGRVLYADKKISTILRSEPLQLRQFLSDTYVNILPQDAQNVNGNKENISRKNPEIYGNQKPDKSIKL